MAFALRPEHLGFRRQGDAGRAGNVSAKAFKSACHAAAAAAGGRVDAFRIPDVTPNFYVAHFLEDDGRIAVLGHLAEPYLAFAEPFDADSMRLEFVDHERLTRSFRDNTNFRPLDTKTLNRPLASSELAEIGATCARVLRYWRADTLGKAMFNWID